MEEAPTELEPTRRIERRLVLDAVIPGEPSPARREARRMPGRKPPIVAWVDAYKNWKRRAVAVLRSGRFGSEPLYMTGVFHLDLVVVFPRTRRAPRPEVNKRRTRYPFTWGPGRNPYVGIPDWDNMCKGPGDAMVEAGVLQDDRWIVSATVEQWYAATGEQAHVHIRLFRLVELPCSSD